MSTPSGLRFAEFADRVGTDFTLQQPGGGDTPLVLTECTPVGPGCFSLIFKAGPTAPVEQSIYQLTASDFGPERIFLVPVARRPEDPQFPLAYQAVFNAVPAPACPPDPPDSAHPLEEETR